MNALQFQFGDEQVADAIKWAVQSKPFPLATSPSLQTSLGIQTVFDGSLDNLSAPTDLNAYLNLLMIAYVRTTVGTKSEEEVPVVLIGGYSRAVFYHFRLLYLRRFAQGYVDSGIGPVIATVARATLIDVRQLAALFNGLLLSQLGGTGLSVPGTKVAFVHTAEYGIDVEYSRIFSSQEYQIGAGYIDLVVGTQATGTDPSTWTIE